MIRKIALALFTIVALACIAIFAIAFARPDTYHVERSIVTAAPPATVHALIEDLHRFPEWSPWQKLDPAMAITYDGPERGVGASSHWVGNKEAGEGRMTITESTAPTSVTQRLEFLKPWASTAEIHFAIAPEGEGSRGTWSMDGNADFMTKLMSLFANLDTMIGRDFEAGLANLRRVAESTPPAEPPAASGT